MEVNHFLSACIWRTELTSPAVKSFMTLQCCGPHSARPASTNQCLHYDSQLAHCPVRRFRSWAKKNSLCIHQLQKYIQAGTHIHKNSGQSAFLCVSLVLVLLCTPVSSASLSSCIHLKNMSKYVSSSFGQPCSLAKPYRTINQLQPP